MTAMLRRHLRTFTLWTGTLLCMLIALAFVASGQWQFMAQAGGACVYVAAGSIVILRDDPLLYPFVVDRHDSGLRGWNSRRSGPRWVEVPIYAVFLAVAVPTLLLWRFGRKSLKPGQRRCGYDPTGNVSGRCPERGKSAT